LNNDHQLKKLGLKRNSTKKGLEIEKMLTLSKIKSLQGNLF